LQKNHEVFIPFTDVYRLGGPEVFKQLAANDGKKNVLVLPMPFVDRLEDGKDLTSEERRFQGRGGKETLKFLKTLKRRSQGFEVAKDGVALYHLNSNLTVATLDKPLVDPESDSFIADLEEKVIELFPSEQEKGRPTLMTARERYHLKFEGKGMRVEDPGFLLAGPDIVNEGIIEGTPDLHALLQERGQPIPVEEVSDRLDRGLYMHQFIQFGRGDFAIVTGDYKRNKSGSRIIRVDNEVVRLLDQNEKSKRIKIGDSRPSETVLGVRPLDMEQYLALQYVLTNPDVELAFVCGGAGSGKTVVSYAAAIDQILCYDKQERITREGRGGKGGRYESIVLLKPFEILGGKRREVGFLPGSLFDKIKDQLKSYTDAHKLTTLAGVDGGPHIPFEAMFLHPKYENDFGKKRPEHVNNARIDGAHFPGHEVIELTYSGLLRGRSFHNTLVLVDEAQNFTPYEMKTIISRLGPGCKVIIMGDPYDQIDNELCTPEINGLTHGIKEFLPRPYSALVPLRHLHRSQMAEDAHNWSSVFQ
jgi:hypothetical protein